MNRKRDEKLKKPISNETSSSNFNVLLQAFKICQNLKSVETQIKDYSFEESKVAHSISLSTDKGMAETVSLNCISRILEVSGLESTKNEDEVNKSFE